MSQIFKRPPKTLRTSIPHPATRSRPTPRSKEQAGPTRGRLFGDTRKAWGAIKKPWTVTHAHGYENNSGATATLTRSAAWERTLEASVGWTGEGGAEANIEIAKLQGKTGYTGLEWKKDEHRLRVGNRDHGDRSCLCFYAGDRNTSGTLTHYVCNSITEVAVGPATYAASVNRAKAPCDATPRWPRTRWDM